MSDVFIFFMFQNSPKESEIFPMPWIYFMIRQKMNCVQPSCLLLRLVLCSAKVPKEEKPKERTNGDTVDGGKCHTARRCIRLRKYDDGQTMAVRTDAGPLGN